MLLLGVWGAAWLAVPAWLKAFAQEQGGAALGREIRIEAVSFRPWSLELEIKGVQVAGATPDAAPLLELERLYVDAELESVFRLAPVVDAVQVDRPVLRLRHLGDGRYDIDDLLTRWAERPRDGESARFGLFNLALNAGEVHWDDLPAGAQHRLRDLSVSVPFLSNLSTQRHVRTEPRIAFELNGSRFDTALSTLPFADTLTTRAQLRLPDLDLAPYLPYWPKTLAWRPLRARLQADLTLQFEQQASPVLQLAGRLAVQDLALAHTGAAGTAGRPLLSWDALTLVLADSQPLARRVHVEQLSLEAPRVHLARNAQGRFNLNELMPGLGSNPTDLAAPAAAVPAWHVKLDRVALSGGTLVWRDAALSPAWETTVEGITLATGALAWPATARTPVELGARWQGASLAATGEVSPEEVDLAVTWRDLGLRGLAPYVDQVLSQPVAGRSSGDIKLHWSAAGGNGPPEAAPALRLSMDNVAVHDLALGPTERPALALRELRLQDGLVDVGAGIADLGQLSLSRPVLRLARDAAGRWVWADWLRASTPAAEAPAAAPSGPSWRLGWQAVRLNDGSGRFDDATTATPVALRWDALRLQLGAWRSDVAANTPVSLAARLAADGQDAAPGSLSLDGRIAQRLSPATPSIEGTLTARMKLDRLPAHSLAPYLGERLNLALKQADTSWSGDLELGQAAAGLSVSAAGDLTVDSLKAVDAKEGAPLLDWKTLNLRGLRLAVAPGQPLRLSVAETALSDYFARVDIDPSGRINLQDLVRAVPADPAAPRGVAPGPQLSFGPITLVNGHIAFSDRFVRPNYSARLTEVTGGLGGFTNQGGAAAEPAKASLRGRVEGTGQLVIEGVVNPLLTPPVLDIAGQVRELALPPLSTYALKYTGHGIERGQLSLDVRYQVGADGQLNASNQLTLNRLVFGDRAPDSQAPNLPVKLAVALLADRNGVIDIQLPISGSLNDPEFRLGPIIGRLVMGLIGKAVTAPFALLGNLLGGAQAQTGRIDFVPGTDRLAQGANAHVSAIVRALNERPGLQVAVVGRSDPAAERTPLLRERLQDALRAEKRRQAPVGAQGAEGDMVVSPEEYATLLREVYRRSDMPKPRNALGVLKDLSVSEMESLWMTHAPAADEAVRELAGRRALAVKARLVAEGLAASRVVLEAAPADAGDPGPRADLQLSLP